MIRCGLAPSVGPARLIDEGGPAARVAGRTKGRRHGDSPGPPPPFRRIGGSRSLAGSRPSPAASATPRGRVPFALGVESASPAESGPLRARGRVRFASGVGSVEDVAPPRARLPPPTRVWRVSQRLAGLVAFGGGILAVSRRQTSGKPPDIRKAAKRAESRRTCGKPPITPGDAEGPRAGARARTSTTATTCPGMRKGPRRSASSPARAVSIVASPGRSGVSTCRCAPDPRVRCRSRRRIPP